MAILFQAWTAKTQAGTQAISSSCLSSLSFPTRVLVSDKFMLWTTCTNSRYAAPCPVSSHVLRGPGRITRLKGAMLARKNLGPWHFAQIGFLTSIECMYVWMNRPGLHLSVFCQPRFFTDQFAHTGVRTTEVQEPSNKHTACEEVGSLGHQPLRRALASACCCYCC